MKLNFRHIFIIILIFFLFYISIDKHEYFVSNNGMGADNAYEFNGPYDYSQDPLLEYVDDSNKGMGSDSSYVFNGPYNYDQNPLL